MTPAVVFMTKHQGRPETAVNWLVNWALKVVFETAVSPAATSGPNACLAIGFSVFLAHGGQVSCWLGHLEPRCAEHIDHLAWPPK